MSRMHVTNEYLLELTNVYHAGQMEGTTWLQKLVGNSSVGVVLKEVSLEVHGGELMAVLGSKGSGKKTLLDVISRRAQGPTRGQILLNGVPMSMRLFQNSCAYVTSKCHLLEGLTVEQTLNYAAHLTIGSRVSGFVKSTRVKQVMADLALLQVAKRHVENLQPDEYRRLTIGVQLLRDPVVILLDEPTWDLDPLHTYLIVSILSNYAKKYNRIILMSCEKPRSDIFPFLDRVTYLCMGDIVYTGATRMLLDYFRHLGFPCPELENPLMYYLCLATVDRRSKEKYLESSNQIAALVDKFRMEGRQYRGYPDTYAPDPFQTEHRLPLTAYGQPSSGRVFFTLLSRQLRTVSPFSPSGRKHAFMRLLLLPLFYFLLWIFYYGMEPNQQSLVSRAGLLFNCLAGAMFMSIATTCATYPAFRMRYYQESRDGLYSGPLFILSHSLHSMTISAATVLLATALIYFGLLMTPSAWQWFLFASTLWAVYVFMEQQSMALMMLVRSSYTAATVSIFFGIIYLVLGSAFMRSIVALPDWLYYLTFITQPRYAAAFLNEQYFKDQFVTLKSIFNGTSTECPIGSTASAYGCRFINGTHFLTERYHLRHQPYEDDLKWWTNFGFNFVFAGVMFFANLLLHVVPLPSFIKSKFRD